MEAKIFVVTTNKGNVFDLKAESYGGAWEVVWSYVGHYFDFSYSGDEWPTEIKEKDESAKQMR